jgi:hypothetical protein
MWEDPPEGDDLPTMPDVDHEIAAWQLRRLPGRWGVVAMADPILAGKLVSLASSIQSGQPRFYRPRGSFEAVVRQDPMHSRLFVRFVGGSNAD